MNGCETNTNTNINNCGSCGTICNVANANEACSAGSCTISSCISPYLNCDGSYANGCEVNKNTDVNNCGVCGTVCNVANANEACSAGSCTISSCISPYLNCDGSYANGCEINKNTNLNNCGTCGTNCVDADSCNVDSCNAGSCSNIPFGCSMTSDLCCNSGCNMGNDADCTICTTNAQCADPNACTTDTCNIALGVCNHAAITCNDGNTCTIDSCNVATGCVYTGSVLNSCTDGNACTTDSCAANGTCMHGAVVCNDGNTCTGDSCSPLSGCITTPLTGTGCVFDANPCTNDLCQGGTCSGIAISGCCTSAAQCNDGKACTQDLCNANVCSNPNIMTCTNSDSCCNASNGCNSINDNDCSATCGNSIKEGSEGCDDGNTNNNDGCSGSCIVEAGYTCNSAIPNVCTTVCGDTLIKGSEVCDSSNLNGKSCATQMGAGYTGTLSCAGNCLSFVTGACVPPVTCGNGVIDSGEQCDGANLNGGTCASVMGFGYTGTLSCSGCAVCNRTMRSSLYYNRCALEYINCNCWMFPGLLV